MNPASLSTFLILVLTVLSGRHLQGQSNVSLLAHIDYSPTLLNDVWGYVDPSGNEYALVGLRTGTSIVDVSDPGNPMVLHHVPGPNSAWRDLKTFGQYAYVTNEQDSGLQIIDLSGLPLSVADTFWSGDSSISFSSSHNVFIDENGFAYVVGADYGIGGAILIDLNADPWNPGIVGLYDQRYVHDCYVRGDTLWTAEVFDGIFSVVDVSDKSNPMVLATQATPGAFTHNVWLSDDGTTLFTTDEVSEAPIAAYDVTDLSNITLLDSYRSNPGSGVLPHNVFVKGSFAVASYYFDGVVVLDASRPNSLVRVGYYDTTPMNSSGCWGVYPYLPSGILLASDIEEGLFVLQPQYVSAAFVEGTVTDFNTGVPLNGVTVSIQSNGTTSQTDLTGRYVLASADTGSVDIIFGKVGYASQVIQNVQLSSGVADTVDVALVPAAIYTLTGRVEDQSSGQGIPGAEVSVENDFAVFSATTNAIGEFAIGNFPAEIYRVRAAKWGYLIDSSLLSLSPQANNILIQLDSGYVDDFYYNFGWTVSDTALNGEWVRDVPIGLSYFNEQTNPSADVPDDVGSYCYLTTNNGVASTIDDVDGGTTTLTTPPIDLTDYVDPYISVDWWFYASLDNGSQGDAFTIAVHDQSQSVQVASFTLHNAVLSQWNRKVFRVADFVSLTDSVYVSFSATDIIQENIVEAAIDRFRVIDGFDNVGCIQPDGLLSNTVDYKSKEIIWTTVPGVQKYEIRGRQLGSANWVTLEIANGATGSLVVQNLPHPATFEWQVRAVCDAANGILSPFSELDTFSTGCFAPPSTVTTGIGSTSALLVWTKVEGAQGYVISGREAGSPVIVNINTLSFQNAWPVFGLTPGTTYEWAVRTKCDATLLSSFSPVQTFVTGSSSKAPTQEDGPYIPTIGFRIFPNPTRDAINVLGPDGVFSYRLLTIDGRMVKDGRLRLPGYAIDVSDLDKGIYLIYLSGNEQTSIKKFIKN